MTYILLLIEDDITNTSKIMRKTFLDSNKLFLNYGSVLVRDVNMEHNLLLLSYEWYPAIDVRYYTLNSNASSETVQHVFLKEMWEIPSGQQTIKHGNFHSPIESDRHLRKEDFLLTRKTELFLSRSFVVHKKLHPRGIDIVGSL